MAMFAGALNDATIKDAYPLPLIAECLDMLGDMLGGLMYMSTLDLASGYWQIELDEKDRHKTAFLTKHGLFEHTRMGFGLCNAPATFQRAMQLVLQGLTWKEVLAYLDDVIVVGKNFEDHLANVENVLIRFEKHGLKLKPKKCALFQTRVTFLGRLISRDGIAINPENIMAVKEWKVPKTVTQVESFLGFVNYHRDHLEDYAGKASPLYELTGSKARKVPFEWKPRHTEAFELLKASMLSAPVLAFPRPEGLFVLDTDASDHAIGGELQQEQDGVLKIIGFGSYVLIPAQKRYCTTRKELLAVLRFTRQFRHYLLGRKFVVRTDHGSLTWLLGFKNIGGQLARWLEELSQYDMQVVHRPGVKHQNADGLSRLEDDLEYCDCYQAGRTPENLPCGGCDYCQRAHSQWSRFEDDVDDVVPLAVRAITIDSDTDTSDPDQPLLGRSDQEDEEDLIDQDSQGETHATEPLPATWIGGYTTEEIRKLQMEDPDLFQLFHWLEDGEEPTEAELALGSPALKYYWLGRQQLEMVDGVLYYRWEKETPRKLLVVPRALRSEVFQLNHDVPTAGHFSHDKTLARLKQKYIWKGMRADCLNYTRTCAVCSFNKKPTRKAKAALRSYHAGAPLERVHIDILGPFHPPSATGNQYVLMLVDQFTKWLECYPLPLQTAELVAKAFVNGFIARFGCPLQVHTDQGRQFEGHLFQAVCGLLQIAKTRTTPYRPNSNGQVERYNRTLLQLIRCFRRGNLDTWDEDLQLLAGAIRACVNRYTGFTPNMMMLGREVLQPTDVLLGNALANTKPVDPPTYVQNLVDTLHEVHAQARENLKASQIRQKRDYDLRAHARTYEAGDLVYELNSATVIGQSSKLQPPWKGPLLITRVVSPILYAVKGRRDVRIVHHDRLKVCEDRDVPLWIRRARHRLLECDRDSEVTQEQQDEPESQEAPEPPQRETEAVTETQESGDPYDIGLEDIHRLWNVRRQARKSPSQPPVTTESTTVADAPVEAAKTRRGREVRRPKHLQDYEM